MSKLVIPTSINIDLEFEVAPFHKRLLAWILDAIIAICYFFGLVKIFALFDKHISSENSGWLFTATLLPIAIYPLIAEITMNGQTFGKKIMKLKVMNEFGGNATISQYFLRWMLRVSDLIMMLMILLLAVWGLAIIKQLFFFILLVLTDFFCLIFTKKGQRIGDIAAGTLLVYTKTKADLNETVFVEIEDTYVPKYPEVMRLSDRDMNMIKNICRAVQKRSDYALAEKTANRIIAVLNITTKESPEYFLETLLKDYNYLSAK